VDKNPMATDLAKLSLWLATLAKDHPFTFLDHSLRAGDSLVGLTRKQIAAFNWNPTAQMSLLEQRIPGAEHRDTSVVVSDLFRQAEETILVAGYAVYQGQKVFGALAERMVERPTLKVRMFLDIQRKPGDTSSSAELVRRFAHRFQSEQWPTGGRLPEVFYDPRSLSPDRSERSALHAKCVVADCRDVFISSANFTEAAQERNVEVGILLHSTSVAENLSHFFGTLCSTGEFLRAL
jgi:phosphatidylserine/phosphatidylglycerophosphate/cardiolipin synthase-like enzyme